MRPEPIASWETLAGSGSLVLLFIYCCVLLKRAAQRQLKVAGFCSRERSGSGCGDVPKKLEEALNWSGGQSGESWERRRAEVRWENRSDLGEQEQSGEAGACFHTSRIKQDSAHWALLPLWVTEAKNPTFLNQGVECSLMRLVTWMWFCDPCYSLQVT